MHKGHFPARYVPGGRLGPRLLDDLPDKEETCSRRAWLVGLGALICTGAVGFSIFRNRSTTVAAAPSPPRRGTLAWALAMRDASDSELVSASGDLEMVSAKHRREKRLVPVFERLLDITLRQDLDHADVAGACAVRSLARLGYPNLALRRQAALTGLLRPETQMAFDSLRRRYGQHDTDTHKQPGKRQ
jgi:hypothetical protein